MTPLERAARALCEIAGNDPDEVCIGEGKATGRTWLGWEAHLSDARKVIGAIREPSEGMLDATDDALIQPRNLRFSYGNIYRAMIDQLLADGE